MPFHWAFSVICYLSRPGGVVWWGTDCGLGRSGHTVHVGGLVVRGHWPVQRDGTEARPQLKRRRGHRSRKPGGDARARARPAPLTGHQSPGGRAASSGQEAAPGLGGGGGWRGPRAPGTPGTPGTPATAWPGSRRVIRGAAPRGRGWQLTSSRSSQPAAPPGSGGPRGRARGLRSRPAPRAAPPRPPGAALQDSFLRGVSGTSQGTWQRWPSYVRPTDVITTQDVGQGSSRKTGEQRDTKLSEPQRRFRSYQQSLGWTWAIVSLCPPWKPVDLANSDPSHQGPLDTAGHQDRRHQEPGVPAALCPRRRGNPVTRLSVVCRMLHEEGLGAGHGAT
ncbi:uncharacterized protein LOC120890617 [Ictidomys tridecemlineatus]